MNKHSPSHRPSTNSWLRPLLVSSSVIVLTLALACSRAAQKSPANAADTDPDQLLRRMSEKLAQAKNLRLTVERKLDAALVEGRNDPENAQIELSVSRPGKLLATSDSDNNTRRVFLDGQNLTISDEAMKVYATVPASGTIDEVVAKIDEKYGFTPPLAEFILSDPYGALSREIKTKSFRGKETIAGIECYHLTLGGDVADSELWITASDLLPRKLVATFKDREGSPQFQADFLNWDLAPALDDQTFAFAAPADAERVEMVTEAQMQQAEAEDAAR